MGDVSKFKDVALITPTEREARAALGDESSGLEVLARMLIEETRNENIIITLGSKGVLAYKRGEAGASGPSEYFCALSANPIDVAGAGDAFLSGSAMSLCSGLNIFEATVLGSLLSAICVERIGNIPVEYEELEGYLSKLARSVID
jgi:sugar/nucleoside kinase (ribokinase family)